jgi:hypothetical protein
MVQFPLLRESTIDPWLTTRQSEFTTYSFPWYPCSINVLKIIVTFCPYEYFISIIRLYSIAAVERSKMRVVVSLSSNPTRGIVVCPCLTDLSYSVEAAVLWWANTPPHRRSPTNRSIVSGLMLNREGRQDLPAAEGCRSARVKVARRSSCILYCPHSYNL